MPARVHTTRTKALMSAKAKARWKDPSYADTVRAMRVAFKYRSLQGAFSTNPLYDPPLDEFDKWEYGAAV